MHHSVTYLYQLARHGRIGGGGKGGAAYRLEIAAKSLPGGRRPRVRARARARKLLVPGLTNGCSRRNWSSPEPAPPWEEVLDCRATASARNPRPCRFIIAAFVSAAVGKRRRPAHTRRERKEPTSLIITSSVEDIYRHDQAVTSFAETYGDTRSLARKRDRYSRALRELSSQSIASPLIGSQRADVKVTLVKLHEE